MSRAIFLFAASALVAHAQSATYRWIHQLGGSGGQSLAGIAADSQGNIYVAGSTTSLDFPVRSAIQPHPAASGLFRVDGPGPAWQNLYQSGVIAPTSVTADPRDPQTIYASTDTGIVRTADAGATWSRVASFGIPVNAVAVDPVNSAILYAATSGQGILKSVDSGVTWNPANTGIHFSDAARPTAYRIWIDPNHPSVVFASAFPAVVRSSDGGASWSVVPDLSALLGGHASDLSFDPFTPGKIYAANPSTSAMSTDDGLTWTGLTRVNAPYWQPEVIIPDPKHQGVLYGGTQESLWKSADSGLSWTLKIKLSAPIMSLDRSTGAIYAVLGRRLVVTTDGFETTTALGPAALPTLVAVAAAGGRVFAGAQSSTDVYVAKYDPDGNLVYATYFGGSSTDLARAMTVDGSGAVYVTGSTQSLDFPVTDAAYAKTGPAFLFKLNPDGTLAWSTSFPVQANAIAVDSAGHAFIAGTALILDPLPVTPGAYQTRFGGQFYGGGIAPVPQPQNGFLTEFDSAGASLIFSTYLGTQSESAGTVVLLKDESIVVASRGQGNLYHLDRTGSTLLGKKTLLADVRALAVDSAGNLLAAGVSGYSAYDPPFPTTQGAFQTALYSTPSLPGTVGNAGIGDAFITRFDPQLNITESTLLGGESSDVALAVASDSAGNIMAGGSTYSKAFPSRGPLQASFSPATGFLAQLNPDLSTLLFSTFAGDTRPFYVRSLVTLPDGGIVIGGSTAPYSYFDGVFPDPTTQTFLVRIDRIQPAAPRIDAVVNAASRLGVPLSPGETIQVRGDGFGDDATLWLNGTPLALHSHTATALTATIPADIHQDVVSVEVRSGAGRTAIPVPVAAASPGVFSQDGTGLGQGYILNKDGTLNSPGNPAMEGDPITIFATGVGSMTFDRGYAVTGAVVDVRVDGFSAAGIAAILGPVDGLPGDVYQISVFVPHPADFAVYNPNLIGFIMPPQVAVTLRINGATSQAGIALSVTH